MRNRLLSGFILFAILASALLVIPVGFTLETHAHNNILAALRRDTASLSTLLANDLSDQSVAVAKKLATTYSRSTGRHVIVVDAAGVVLATERRQVHDRRLLDVSAQVRATAVSGVTARTAFEGPQYYVATPLRDLGDRAASMRDAVLIVTFPVTVVTKAIRGDWQRLATYAALMIAAACLFGLVLSNSMVRPLRRIVAAVDAMGAGQLDARAPPVKSPREMARLAETVNFTAARLIALLEAQRNFVEDASHQLRTPLTALQLHLENLEMVRENSSSDDLASVFVEVDRLNRLVDSLLAMARNEAQPPVLVPVDVTAAVVDRVQFWRPFAEERNVAVTLDVPDSIELLAIDGAVEQILDIFLSNAFDATALEGHIEVSVRASDVSVEIHVTDSGVGLGDDERELALRRFWRGPHNANPGSGLGLAIADQLARLSNGRIELRNSPVRGVDATLVMPVRRRL